MSGGIWAPYKELASVVNQAILKKQPDAFYSLEAILKKHKTDFISLLKNPTKNSSHRSQVEKAVKDGLQIPSLPSIHTLPQDFIDEALILSDILDLNEISSVELLLAGEQQLPRFPTLTRGLVSILLYYDGRCSMVASLRTLIQAREGVSWSLGLKQATVNLVTAFTDELFADGLVKKILDLINTICVKDELEKLAKGRAIGDAKHHQQIIDYINEQRACLADCLLHWACQNPFPKDETLLLYGHLQRMKVEPMQEEGRVKSVSGVGTKIGSKAGVVGGAKEEVYLDAVGVALFNALLACFNIGDSTAENAVDVSLVDEDRYPLVTDATFVPTMHAEILKGPGQWATPRLYAAVEFAWGIVLRECAGRAVFTESGMSELEDDDALVDDAVKMGAIHFLRQSVVASQHFHQEELCVQRIHWLVTSFIVNMPLKVNELRNQGDEIAREMAMLGGDRENASQERRGFEEFMKLIGDLYSSDPNNLQLALEYWTPAADQALQYQHGTTGLSYRTPQRQLSLYKFITSCSDLLPAQLFSPFMHMLIGLSSSPNTAHCCFNFLKANSPSLGGGGASAAISLDHFFSSLKQYYYSLSRDSAHKATPTGCAITPQELEGLKNVLRIIQTIAKHDETARVVMYENQSWLPVASLFGLVGCPVPRDLKAEILLTLAAFALSPEIASNMWITLEVSQILNTVHSPLTGMEGDPSHHAHHQHGFALREGSIQVELEEIESQAEEYQLTRAFLSLLSALLDVPPSPTLGAGHRVPGFEPYLVFVRDAVFLKFDCRAYQNQEEKWEVATLALDVLYKLLSSHEFTEDDFQDSTYQLPNREVATVPKSPGHSLLVHLMNNSQVLRKLLSLLDEACRYLSDASQTFSDPLARAALLSLKILENTLEREQEFLELLRRYNTKNIIVNPLHQLLLGINPRTGKADHMVTIAKYVCVGNSLPELALTSVQILYWVTQSHKTGRDVVTTIVSDKDASAEILGGFVEHLEADVDTPESQEDHSLETVASVNRAVQVAILKLIASCINKSSPNIAHYLLGFEIATGKPISQTTLQDPGILGSPRTCLHSILSLVEHGQDARNPTGCHYTNTKVAEFCYKVLYLMCASRDLSTPTLRYLRNNHEYFFSQLVHLPLNPDLLSCTSDEDAGECGDSLVAVETTLDLKQLSLMHQQAWVLKSVAIELRMTSLSHQRSHTQRIVNLLLSGPSSDVTDVSSSDGMGVSVGGAGGGARLKSDFDFLQEGRRKVLVLLDQVDFADKAIPALEPLEFPHLAAIEQMVQSCEAKDPISDQLLTDEKRLLKLLNNAEISSTDVRRLMSYVESRNHVNSHLNTNYELFESWRQLVEVMLHCLVHSDMKKELKIAVLFELIQDLLLKVAHVEPSQLTTSVQGVVLILLSHLRQTVNSSDPEQDDAALSSLYSGPLHGIMRGLIDNILKAPAAMQQAKAYLYGSLLYYLTMTKQEDSGGQRGKGFSLWQPDSDQNNIASGNLSTLNSFGESFMDTICKNACSGHDVARMLSLSLLDSIISLDWQGSWLRFMSQRGFLQTLCASIQWEDESLQKMLQPAPEALKALYIYESKMAFLTQVASNPIGARDIVSLNALNYVAQCSFIEMRPSYYGDSMGGHMTSGFIPTSFDRYRQLFLPLLKFLIALLTCPGAHHKEACVQVASFIGLHSEVFAAVLKEPLHASMDTMATLQELSLVTAVISHSGIGQDLFATSAQAVTALGAALHRLQRLMMSLLPHFWSKQNWHLLAQKAVNVEDSDGSGVNGASNVNTDEAFLLIQQITANIVSYCQVAMTLGGTELSSPYCCILLTPDLSEALSMPKAKEQFLRRDLSSGMNAPSLGLLIQHLKECTEGYFTALEAHQQHTRKLESGGKLSSDEMRQLLHGVVGNEKLLPSQQQSLARKRLQQIIANRKTEMQLYSYIVENMLYILWRHLQYYLVHCKPVDPDISLGVPGIDRSGLRRLQDLTSYSSNTTFELSSLGDGVRTSDLEELKANAIKCLTDGFFKKLLDLEEAQLQSKAEMRVGFVQALVRRIRRLLKLRAAAF